MDTVITEDSPSKTTMSDYMPVKRSRDSIDADMHQLLYTRDLQPKWYFTSRDVQQLTRWFEASSFPDKTVVADKLGNPVSPSTKSRARVRLLRFLANHIKQHCVAPISEFQVGVAALGESGAVYLGVNIEFKGQPLSNAVHGEQCAISNALRHNERRITNLAVNAMPCGHCRQFLNELRYATLIQIHAYYEGNECDASLSELLPSSFGPGDLGIPKERVALTDQGHAARIVDADVADGEGNHIELGEEVRSACVQGISHAYSPHSKSPSAVVLQSEDGKIVWGSYIENAAYNPSLPPVQGALIAYLQQVGSDWSTIRGVYVVEGVDSTVRQLGDATQFFKNILPEVDVVHVPVTIKTTPPAGPITPSKGGVPTVSTATTPVKSA